MQSAHIDTFARDNLPPPEQQPQYLFDLPALRFPLRLNCATELLDRHVAEGRGDRICIQAPGGLRWSYADLLAMSNRIANVLVNELGLVPGNRVLLRAPNNPLMAACWFAVMKAGGIAVATMPLLRAKELVPVIVKAEIGHALCDARLAEELKLARADCPTLKTVMFFNGPAGSERDLESAMARQSPLFENVATAADDTCIIAFTSGTTGEPKGTMHFHRDVMAICACWPPHVLRPRPDDIFIGSPPLAFTFGLGGLVLFPMAVGASTVLLEKASPQQLIEGIRDFGATVLFTAPTSYRQMAAHGELLRTTPLRQCVSAGEALPAATRALWQAATGIELIDGIGATEMLHIFISADEASARPGATGKPIPGYQAQVVGDDGAPLPAGRVGKLAVRGPTGCRYLADPRQATYVQNGWNLTGDAYLVDADGYFHYQSRTDDMIVSAGYNIASPEVESALLLHPKVAECGVIGVADGERGQIVKAFVVLKPEVVVEPGLIEDLQDFVKRTVAPYKYPRAIEFRSELPRTETGKLQRFRLREPSPSTSISGGSTHSGLLQIVPPAEDQRGALLKKDTLQVLLPPGWPRPRGYANGVAATGRMVFVAGMVGWDAESRFVSDTLAGQARQALANIVAVLAVAGARPEHIVRMTWYVTDKREYVAAYPEIGSAFRELIGSFNAAMTAVEVRALIEDRAKVEIEVTAVIPGE